MRKDRWSLVQQTGAKLHIGALCMLTLLVTAIQGNVTVLVVTLVATFSIGVSAWFYYSRGPYTRHKRWRYHVQPAAVTLAILIIVRQSGSWTWIQLTIVGLLVGLILEAFTVLTINVGRIGLMFAEFERPIKTPEEALDKFCELCFANPKGTSWEHKQLVTRITRLKMDADLKAERLEAEVRVWAQS